jgi:hypothetical protein
VRKLFKYSVVAVENLDEGVSKEIAFEDHRVIKPHEQRFFKTTSGERLFTVTSVMRVDHVQYPNVPFDYRLFAVGTGS